MAVAVSEAPAGQPEAELFARVHVFRYILPLHFLWPHSHSECSLVTYSGGT